MSELFNRFSLAGKGYVLYLTPCRKQDLFWFSKFFRKCFVYFLYLFIYCFIYFSDVFYAFLCFILLLLKSFFSYFFPLQPNTSVMFSYFLSTSKEDYWHYLIERPIPSGSMLLIDELPARLIFLPATVCCGRWAVSTLIKRWFAGETQFLYSSLIRFDGELVLT